MDSLSSPDTLLKLADLLDPEKNKDLIEKKPPSKDPLTPATIVQQHKADKSEKAKSEKSKPSSDIWEEKELKPKEYFLDETDTRERPQYEIIYKQSVTPMDVYLGLDFEKNPSSACVDALCVKISLPKCKDPRGINLDVFESSLVLSSSQYKLGLQLPRHVLKNKAEAQWDSKKKILSVTVPVDKDHIDLPEEHDKK